MENGGRGNVSKNNERSKKGSLPWYKLFMFADTIDKFLMVGGVLGALGNGLTLPIMTVLFGSLTNAFGQNSPPDVHQQVSKVSVNFVFLGIASGIASFLQVSCWMCTEERQASRIRSLYLETILKQDIAYFDTETSTGEVVGNISGDTALIQDAMGKNVGTFIQLMTTFSGALIVAFIKGWKLTLVLLVVLPIQVFMGVAMGFAIRKTAYKSQEAYGNASTVVDETLGAIRTVASFSGEKKAITDYDISLKPACKAAVHQGLALGLGLGSFLFVMFCSYSLALWYGSILIIKEGYSGGRVINVVFALLSGGMALGQVSTPLNAFATGQAAAFKLFEVFKRKPVIDPNDPDGMVLEDIQGDVELKQVSFSYPARPDVQIFSDFSLTMPRGTITAIVGESGSGKSTVISLIERFYDPQSGEILIDGIDIKKFQLKWIRQKIALVSQEPVLFATSIKENISYGKEGATLEEIISAAKLANAATFINTMPLGFETLVGEHGAQLSGGQKQRIAIARAILRDPRILLLDEATSALDAESEKVVQEALNTVMVNRTTVIVAHRLTTIRNANSIAVVHRGYIVEKGPHALLIANPVGAYSQLVRLQEMHETSEGKEAKNSNDSSIHQNEQNDAVLSENPSLRQPSLKIGGSQHFVDFAGENVILRNDENEKNKPSILTWFSRLKSKRDLEKGKLNTEKSIPISRLAVLNKPEIPILALGSFAAIIAGISLPIHGLLFSSVIYSLFKPPHELRKDIDFWCLMFVLLGISQILMVPIQRYCFAIAGGKLVQRIRVLTFKNVIYQEIGWFDESENSSGAIVARLSTDAANVRSLVGDALSLLVQNIATITAGFVIGFTANWKLTLLLLAFVPFFGLQGWIQMRFLKRVSSDTKVRYEQASQVANEAVGSIRTVASFCAEETVLKLYNVKCSNALQNGAQKGLIAGVGLGFSNFVMYSAYALLFWVGSRMVKNGETKFGDVFKVFFGMVMAAVAVSNSMGMAPDFGKVKSSVNSIYKVIDKTSKIDASDAHGVVRENLKGEIKYHHVSFRYPSRQNVQIFRDLNIFFPAGKTAALVGESGSGKSTVISLLQRFYNPDSGNILLDGIDISTLQVKWLRQQMGLVGQEPVLFNNTIRSNIAYGKDGIVSDEQIVAAAEASNAHSFISALPQGYDTRVGERGIQLSGGQKQRIAIARAILRDPKVLLLDEATSALDAESERVVQDALDHVKVNRTTIVVAHRLSTIRDADMIAVVKNGVIAEQGKHDELLASKDGTYATLVRLHVSSS